jgi:hypothetical protein
MSASRSSGRPGPADRAHIQKQGKVKVKNPKAGKGVSFKAKAKVTDKKGNTLTQTIINAYRTK